MHCVTQPPSHRAGALPVACRRPLIAPGHSLALSCDVAPSGSSPLLMPCLILVMVGWRAHSPTIQRLKFYNFCICLFNFGGEIYTNPRKTLGARMLGGPGPLWDRTFSCSLSLEAKGSQKESGARRWGLKVISQAGGKDHACKLHSLVPPANTPHPAWAAVVKVMGGGLNWEETAKNTAALGGLILHGALR